MKKPPTREIVHRLVDAFAATLRNFMPGWHFTIVLHRQDGEHREVFFVGDTDAKTMRAIAQGIYEEATCSACAGEGCPTCHGTGAQDPRSIPASTSPGGTA